MAISVASSTGSVETKVGAVLSKPENGTLESKALGWACTQLAIFPISDNTIGTARLVASYSVRFGAVAGKPSTTTALVKIPDGSCVAGMFPPEAEGMPVNKVA